MVKLWAHVIVLQTFENDPLFWSKKLTLVTKKGSKY